MKKTICVDFDGVVHKYSKGWIDGTIYDEPMDGCTDALEKLSTEYRVVILTSRTDYEPILKWLAKYGLNQYISDVTNTKPIAKVYIDDRAVRFTNWRDIKKLLY